MTIWGVFPVLDHPPSEELVPIIQSNGIVKQVGGSEIQLCNIHLSKFLYDVWNRKYKHCTNYSENKQIKVKCTTKTAYNHTQNLALGLGTIDSLQQNMVSVVRMLEKGSKNKGKSTQSLLQKAASSARLNKLQDIRTHKHRPERYGRIKRLMIR